MGIIMFSQNSFANIDSSKKQSKLMTTLHEVTHVLAFSFSNFPLFIDENGFRRINPVINFTSETGQQQQGLATPNVLAYARKFYGCDSW